MTDSGKLRGAEWHTYLSMTSIGRAYFTSPGRTRAVTTRDDARQDGTTSATDHHHGRTAPSRDDGDCRRS